MRMKLKRNILYIGLSALLCLTLASCTADGLIGDVTEEWNLLQGEYREILAFFDRDLYLSPAESTGAVLSMADEGAVPALNTAAHTELLPSPYNSGLWTVFDVANGENSVGAAYRSKAGYVHIPLFDERDAKAVSDLFLAIGAAVETEIRPNPTPAGEVFALRYGGFSDGEGYYVNPIVPVTLYVSAEKAAVTQEGRGHNVIYLTYDDGPTQKDTLRLLDVLDTYGVKATFFTTGESVSKYPASAVAIAERGHTLACHSVTHQYEKIYADTEALYGEIVEWERLAEEAGVTLDKKLFRYPGGSVSKYVTEAKEKDMTAMLEGMGYTVFDWNVVTNDSLLYMAEEDADTYEYIRTNFIETMELCLRENSKKENAPIIILMHETVPETVDLMPWMLEYLMDQGFVFGDLSTFGESWTFADREG